MSTVVPSFHLQDRQRNIDEMADQYIQRVKHQIPPPIRKGELFSVNIDDSVHQRGVKEHENCLIERVMLS